MFHKSVKAICKKRKIPIKNIIFCRDCKQINIWRREFFPEYKAQRDYTNFEGGTFFAHSYDTILPEFEKSF